MVFHSFKNILHIDGLKANLISISQICDLKLDVNFNHEKYVVLDTDGKCVLEAFRSVNNYCTLILPSYSCHKVNSNDTKLWHEMLGHLNFKTLRKLSNAGAFQGFPKLAK